jgi:hypothetical protein
VINIKKNNYYVKLGASILMIIVAFWKLNQFYAPKVGPIGNSPSDSVVVMVWVLFGISMILGFGGVIYFTYSIIKKR